MEIFTEMQVLWPHALFTVFLESTDGHENVEWVAVNVYISNEHIFRVFTPAKPFIFTVLQ
jgi:hypothetical protein